jgi:RND family efflux transporter MFP subunit
MAETIHRWRKPLLTVLAIAVAAGLSIWLATATGALGGHERENWPQATPVATHEPGSVVVTVEALAHRPVQRSVEAVGTLWGYEEVVLSTKVEGRVKRILHDVSDRVKPGELLLEIDPTDATLAVHQAEKALAVDLARLGLAEPPKGEVDVTQLPLVMQAKARLENSQSRLERAQRLSSTRSISAEELADRQTEQRAFQAEYDSQLLLARTSVATSQLKHEELRMAQQRLADTRVVAPTPTQKTDEFEGALEFAIVDREVSEGTYVRAGSEVFKLVIEQTLKLKVSVPERYSAEVKAGQAVEVFTAAYPKPFAGTVARVNPRVDPATRTFEVEIRVPNAKSELKAGSFAKASILTRIDAEAITAPLESIVSFAGITKVFLNENGKAREVPVTLGVQSTTWVEIASPALPPGAQLVTSGQSALADGTPIAVRKGTSAKRPDNDTASSGAGTRK